MIRSASSSVHATSSSLRASLPSSAAGSRLLSTSIQTGRPKPDRPRGLQPPQSSPRRQYAHRKDTETHEDGPTRILRPLVPKAAKSRGFPSSERPLLRPYALSSRLQQLCREGKLDDAITHLQSMPLDAQNEAVWNTMIQAALRKERYQLSYRLYIDMKRRGFVPNIKTYATMFAAFIAVKDWTLHAKLLQQVGKLHDDYLKYAAHFKVVDPASDELSTAPTRAYLRILGTAGQHQLMFDVFNAMDEEGPMAPDLLVHSAMLQAVCMRHPIGLSPDAQSAVRKENAAQAKLLWRRLLKFIEKNPPAQVDSYHVREMLYALSHSSPSDHLLAFDIIRDYLGLAKPGESPKPPVVALEGHSFAQVLHLCNSSQKYRLTVHFFHEVLQRPVSSTQGSIITEAHVESVLRAHASLAMMNNDDYEARQALDTLLWLLKEWAIVGRSDQLQPRREHFDVVLSCCYRTGNWALASHTFEVLTGYRVADFADGAPATNDDQLQPHLDIPEGRTRLPDTVFLSHLVRTALTSGDVANMRQCLRMVEIVDPSWFYPHPENRRFDPTANTRQNVANNMRFYASRLAEDVVTVIDKVVPKDAERESHTPEEGRWLRMRARAKGLLRVARESDHPVSTPFLAENPLGGERSLAATNSFVDYDMTVRRTAGSRSTKR
ncbi:uncharacterized protein B0H18DRAFT_967898 [Fomitopsis serialis]|uniref:uncharacterized protein n=1 Tax=Fomitopsis serialis TaxID=139415 RepID=UPI0020086C4C|nr:uncharacterized protein B0H18DRAFT_967898 [Neoantrodia serialis]KAH9938590.1 hypothetical protein B0H18DRAFT_967898 [Neoantrodia serialis]